MQTRNIISATVATLALTCLIGSALASVPVGGGTQSEQCYGKCTGTVTCGYGKTVCCCTTAGVSTCKCMPATDCNDSTSPGCQQ